MAKRTCLEKCLIILVIIVVIVVIIFAAFFIIYHFFYSPPEGTCLTERCVAAASRLKDYMDDSKDPCNNFYDYACGKWTTETVLAPDEKGIDIFTTIRDSNNNKIKRLLEQSVEPTDPKYVERSKQLFTACMDNSRRKKVGAGPLLERMADIGKFPTLDPTWSENDTFSLEDTIVKVAKLNVMPLLTINVKRDDKKRTVNRLNVNDATLPLKIQTSNDEKVLRNKEEYEKLMVETLTLLGADREQAEDDMKAVMEFEIDIAKIMRDDIFKRDEETKYNPLKVVVIESRYPWMDWLKLFQQFVASTEEDVGTIAIDSEETINIMEPKYIEKLGTLIAETPKRVLVNYMMSKLVAEYMPFFTEEFAKLSDDYKQETLKIKPVPQWEFCTIQAIKVFPDYVSRMYVDNFFSPQAKSDVTGIIGDLTAVFKNVIRSNKWMAQKTKTAAINKVDKMGFKVGYPESLMDDSKLNNKYKLISASQYEFLEFIIQHNQLLVEENTQSLKKQQDKTKWTVPAVSVQAEYNVHANDITFPAAFLQPPIYNPEYTYSMNYGGMGTLVGHEISHAFDVKGSQYDENGELNRWWTDKDLENFKEATQCFVDQYGCFKFNGKSIDGDLTLSNNIADNGGLKTSYLAYDKVIDREGMEEQRLPGLKLSHRQIFFLSFAQVWCSKIKEGMLTESDTPPSYRVRGALQNSKEFSEAYSCEREDRMNPGRKCGIW